MDSTALNTFKASIFSFGLLLTTGSNVNAATVNYILDNVFLSAASQMTGSFEWSYTEGDFENGAGQFTELFIPGTTQTLSDLNITFDLKKSIEFTLIANLDNDGVDITLVLENPLLPTSSTLFDLNTSKWSLGATGTNYSFISGGISVATVPVPAATWLLGSGLLGLFGFARHKST